LWLDYYAAHRLDSTALPLNSTWRNHKCDVLALWSHIHDARDVFVTNDEEFHKMTKKAALLALGSGRIESAETAATLV
jgi:pyruvate/2-oxoglutarate dehydrogenase complex dihydrolipoamide dehydrogenase (E3) component